VGFAEAFLPLAVLDEDVLPDLDVVFGELVLGDEDVLPGVELPLFIAEDLLFDDFWAFWSSGVNACADGVEPTSRELSRTTI
jgi:hypothetical protein